jgi:hypothetical protein
MAIRRVVTPSPVVVQIFVTDHIAGNVLRGRHFIFTLFAFLKPMLESVRTRCRCSFIAHLVRSGENVSLARGNVISGAACGHFTRATNHLNDARSAVGIYVHAVIARAQNRVCQIWRVQFVGLIVLEMKHPKIGRALGHLNLDRLVTQIEE